DNIHGGNDAAGATTANGQNAGIILDANTQATVSGGGDTITENAGDSLVVTGGGNTIYTGPDEALEVSGTNGSYDNIHGGDDAAGATTANGQNAGIILDANTQATVSGSGDTITGGAGDSLIINGVNDTANISSGTVNLNENNEVVTIIGSNDTLGAAWTGDTVGFTGTNDTANISSGTVNLNENNENATIIGNNDTLGTAWTGDTVGFTGTNDTANISSGTVNLNEDNENVTVIGDYDTVTGSTDAFLTVEGANDTITNGNGGKLTLESASNDSFTPGSNATIDIAAGSNNNRFNMEGTGDAIIDDGSNNTFNGTIAGANDETFTFGDNSSHNVVTGSNLVVHLGNNLSLTVTGSHDIFTGGDGDTLNIIGSNDTVDTNHAHVTFSGGSNDKIAGAGDEQNGGVYTYTTTYVTTYTYTVFYGLDADITKPMNVIGQYDLSHGLSANAADHAWSLNEQAIDAGTGEPGAVAPSLLVGGLVDDRRPVTWSFAETPPQGVPLYGGTIEGAYQAAVEQALDTWSKAAGIDFEQVADSAASDIRIGWGNLDTADTGVVGVTLLKTDAGVLRPGTVIELENPQQDPLMQASGETFTYAGSQVGLQQLALHEIGHALGLAESADPTSIMYPLLGSHNKTLSASDIADIASLYPTARDASVTSSMIQAMASFTGTSAPIDTSVSSPQNNAEQLLSVPAHTS
ncbi:matrixin family metalloprotease, partial [Nguyenibacter vanlangensis]